VKQGPTDIIVQTFEEGGRTPVVTHIFHGKTYSQALGFYKAHLRADRFLRDCNDGHFGKMACRNVLRIRRLT
jgi:hypothetical protein